MARNKRIQKKILKVISSDNSSVALPSFYQNEYSKILKNSEVIINGIAVIHPGFLDCYTEKI
jgi:hypothetical protein